MVVWHTDHLLNHYNYTGVTGVSRSMRSSGANNGIIGLAKSVKEKPGDIINMEV